MDKLRPYLAVLQKYQFWIACGSMLLVATVCWWLATASLAAQCKTRTGTLNGEFQSVTIQPGHPNDAVVESINKQNKLLKQQVFDAWEILYKDQKEKNPFPTAVLGEEFQGQFENLKLPQDKLDPKYLERYQTRIPETYLPMLKVNVNARRPKVAAARTADGSGGRRPSESMTGRGIPSMQGSRTRDDIAAEDLIGIVEWDDNDYLLLEKRFSWNQSPSTFAVVTAQEDLWVYEALLRVIKNTNAEATSYLTAPVKQINNLDIADAAVLAWRQSAQTVGGTGAQAGAVPMGAMQGMMGRLDLPPGTGGATAQKGGAELEIQKLMQDRYVDGKRQALPYQSEYPYAAHPNPEFKMMPIRMKLFMDQRHLARLLVECANSNMPIEVDSVRIASPEGGTTIELPLTQAATGSGGPAGSSLMSMDFRGGAAGRSNPGRMLERTGDNAGAKGAYDVSVEIQGVIYIYSKPDLEKVGTGAGAAPADTASPSGQPSGPLGNGLPSVPQGMRRP